MRPPPLAAGITAMAFPLLATLERRLFAVAFRGITTPKRRLILLPPSLSFPETPSRYYSVRRVLYSTTPQNEDATDGSFIQRQKELGQSDTIQTESDHLKVQRQVFDEMAPTFAARETISDELIPVYQYLGQFLVDPISQSMPQNQTTCSILDVACGSGALFPFLNEQFHQQTQYADTTTLHLEGVDLSPQMVQAAKECAETITDENSRTSIEVWESDFMQFNPPLETLYDGIVFNACFGNFWSPPEVLERAAQFLRPPTPENPIGGQLFVSHPLGADFVQQLHDESPQTVPHSLPRTTAEWDRLTQFLPLQLESLQTQVALPDGKRTDFYGARLSRVRHRCLPQLMRLRGPVATGYGRGGKKLGFPTANLRPALFRTALETLPTGVYFGWAVIERESKGDSETSGVHKAVVNVGLSPTFQGEENAEKIVEAHLIVEEGGEIPDFYGETMRLQLHGFLRPELKFESFPALIAQIGADKQEATLALDRSPYASLKQDAFLSPDQAWVGKEGGDSMASWEFQDTNESIEAVS